MFVLLALLSLLSPHLVYAGLHRTEYGGDIPLPEGGRLEDALLLLSESFSHNNLQPG